MRLARVKADRVVFESERPQRIAKLIESAKSQIKTPEYNLETRIVEYTEKFYQKYCGVRLAREQVNQIRLNWKQIIMRDCDGKWSYPELLRTMAKNLKGVTHLDLSKIPSNGLAMCEECQCEFWNTIEGTFDFYLLEPVNGGLLVGTRFSNGKEMTVYLDHDTQGRHCECESNSGYCDSGKGKARSIIRINHEVKDNLPEPLRAQKYVSEEIDRDPTQLSWKVRILSNGYGKDSVTEIALNHAYYDEIVFSDTGSEQPETYAYIDYLSTKLPSVARNKIRIVHSRYGVIYDYYFNKKIQPIPARRDCTGKFKVEPIKQVLTKVYGINPMGFKREIIGEKDGKKIYDSKIEMSIGINYSEPDRMNSGGVWYMKNRYPLVEKKVEKKDEKGILEALDYVVPVKSGCFFCPYGTQPYWKGLKRDHPELYEKAKAMQDNSTLKQKFIKFKDNDKTDVELSCSCFNGNWESEEELETKNNWSF